MKTPIISVVMSTYKESEEWLHSSINSILHQTYQDFEFIIINDNPERELNHIILEQYVKKDSRVKVIENDKNRGLIYSLNKGLEASIGKYIARMDADDISMPVRFEKQISYLEEHPNCVVCGSFFKYFGDSSNMKTDWIKENNDDLKAQLLVGSCFVHPSVMIRRDILVNNNLKYDFSYVKAEDYALWSALASKGDFYNIPQVLLQYRLSPTQITATLGNPSALRMQKININNWLKGFKLGIDFSKKEEITGQFWDVLNSLRTECKKKSPEFRNFMFLTYASFKRDKLYYFFCSIFKGDIFSFSFLNIIRYAQIVIGQRQPKVWEE